MPEKRANLRELFKVLDKKIESDLSPSVENPSAKGAETESVWLELFEKYLPERYTVSSGFVVDSDDQISDQIDVVIYDRHFTPFVLKLKETNYIPAEAVYAAFEVKQEFSKEDYEYAVEKFNSVKKLKITNAPFADFKGSQTKQMKDWKILGGLITKRMGSEKQFEEAKDLDIILSFDYALKLRGEDDHHKIFKKGENPISALFMLKLIEKLRTLGSCPPLDVDAYLKWIE
ncbi:MAG: hypothetical protein LBM19_03910 [Holosporales bacterium]|jgi:hypothetical protein|nr:hypothetical protein [Holosporales bacterium]